MLKSCKIRGTQNQLKWTTFSRPRSAMRLYENAVLQSFDMLFDASELILQPRPKRGRESLSRFHKVRSHTENVKCANLSRPRLAVHSQGQRISTRCIQFSKLAKISFCAHMPKFHALATAFGGELTRQASFAVVKRMFRCIRA